MTIKRVSKLLLLGSIIASMIGCKLAVIVVEGGEVRSTGSGICVASAICIVEVSDPGFSETFTASADDGWYFHKWSAGSNFFCTGSTNPRCILSFQGHEESKAVDNMVSSSETFYLMPVFRPYEDVITVDGKQWLQPDRFKETSWAEINAVCPGGACITGGRIRGYDMTGWTWASVNELNALFNYYLGTELLGPGPSGMEYLTWDGGSSPPNRHFGDDFYSDGWRAISESFTLDDPSASDSTWTHSRAIFGWVSDKAAQDYIWAEFSYLVMPFGSGLKMSTNRGIMSPVPFHDAGAGVYRTQ